MPDDVVVPPLAEGAVIAADGAEPARDELLSVIPSSAVAATKQTGTSRALFECETGGYYWTGTLDVVLRGDADGPALLAQIKADRTARSVDY